MKIAFDYQIFSLQKYGGISRYFFELSSNINKNHRNSDIHVVSPFYINNYLNKNYVSIKGVKVPGGVRIGKILFYINRFISTKIILDLKPDILHQTYHFDSSHFNKFKGKKVLTIHDMIHEIYPNYFPNSQRYIEAKKNAVRMADHIICVSKSTRDDLIKILGVKYEKITVIPHGYFYVGGIKQNRNLHLKKPFILYVGSRYGYKNFKNLLAVFASNKNLNKNYNLVAFGGGPFSNLENILIKELGLSRENVIYLQGDDYFLKELYSNAEIFVYPSLYEGFGLPPLEAMSCGCPVACSFSSSIPEVVGNAASFFDPNSLSSINSTIISLINNKEKKNQLINKGFDQIKNFGWDKCTTSTLATYRKLI
tara:strand:- start:1306 stop:2406 length:1101 start_codon:yes stop_codon:yes gene_type:complete